MPLLPFSSSQAFQRQWEQLTPQNAAQVFFVDGNPDPELVESAFQSALRDLGLGRIEVAEDDSGYSHEVWSGHPPAPLVSQHSQSHPILQYVEAELNRPFPASPCLPYRAFTLQQPQGLHMGIVFQQWAADSAAISILLREWFLRIFQPANARRRLIDLPTPATAIGPTLGLHPHKIARGLRNAYCWLRDARSCTRFPTPATREEPHVRLHPIHLLPGQMDRLLLRTRAEGLSLDDLFGAALASSLGRDLPQITGHAWFTRQGRSVAIASSVDLRQHLPGKVPEVFGFLQAFVPLQCVVPGDNVLDMAQQIARQMRAVKDPNRIASRLLISRLLVAWAGLHSPQSLQSFCRRRVPILATVANIDLNKTWVAEFHPTPIRRYLRFASPSPAMPLALSVSALGDELAINLASQRSVVDDATAARLATGFAQTLQSLVQ